MKRLVLLVVPLFIGCSETNTPVHSAEPVSSLKQKIERQFDKDLAYARGKKQSGAIHTQTFGLEGKNLTLFCSIVKTADAVIDTVKAIHDLRENKATPKDETPDELAAETPNTKVDGNGVKFVADEDAGTTSGASQAATIDDENSGLLAIGFSIAKTLGLGIDEMCKEDSESSESSDEKAQREDFEKSDEEWSKYCTPFEEGSCGGGLLCAHNGGAPSFCCRPAVTGGTKCYFGVEGMCPAGEVCSNASNDVEGEWYCAAPETCR